MWRTRQGLESVEDQVSADIDHVVQTSKPDLLARGVAFNLLQMTKRISPQCKAAKYKDLSGEKSLTLDCIASMIVGAIKTNSDDIDELSMKAPMSVSKPADLG